MVVGAAHWAVFEVVPQAESQAGVLKSENEPVQAGVVDAPGTAVVVAVGDGIAGRGGGRGRRRLADSELGEQRERCRAGTQDTGPSSDMTVVRFSYRTVSFVGSVEPFDGAKHSCAVPGVRAAGGATGWTSQVVGLSPGTTAGANGWVCSWIQIEPAHPPQRGPRPASAAGRGGAPGTR